MAKKIWTLDGVTPAKANQVIKTLKGVYFVTPDDPKVTDLNTRFRVRVGKGEGKEGIWGRINSHQSSNFDRLYFTVLSNFNYYEVSKKNRTPLELEKHIHKIFKEKYKVSHRDSWYEFKNVLKFLRIMEENFVVYPVASLKPEQDTNINDLFDVYKYTNTNISFQLPIDPMRQKLFSSFDWFCSSPVEKKPIRGAVFKDNLVYEEYFEHPETYQEYRDILGGYVYITKTEIPAPRQDFDEWTKENHKKGKWLDILIIGKELKEVPEVAAINGTPFMKLLGNRHYYEPATPIGDALIILGCTPDGDACSLQHLLCYYNYYLDYPCYNINVTFPKLGISKSFKYRGHNQKLTPEGQEFQAKMEQQLQRTANG